VRHGSSELFFLRQYPDVYFASVFLSEMKSKLEEQSMAVAGRWLRLLRDTDTRDECRDQFEEWFSEEEMDEAQLRVTLRLWRNVVREPRR